MKKKIVCPSMCEVYTRAGNKDFARAFAKIELSDDGRLSICGVVGPMSNGNCRGSAGQCADAIRSGDPTDEWTAEMLQKFCDIWDEWHLNDMHPECEHQRELGWVQKAKEDVTIYHWYLNDKARKYKEAAKKRAMKCLTDGSPFIPESTETFFASLPSFCETYTPEAPEHYDIHKDYNTKQQKIEHKTLGWMYAPESSKNGVTERAHPDGILCKPCPVCGYKYGSTWKTVAVPDEIIEWLFALPDTPVKPAWI